MKKLITVGTLGIAGAVTTGLLAYPTVASASDSTDSRDDSAAFVRKDDTPDAVLAVDDDDDDDTFGRDHTRTRTQGQTRTRTRTRGTDVSRDRDLSRGDKVRDWTRDGGTRTRDRSAHHTNDRSRHDTRR